MGKIEGVEFNPGNLTAREMGEWNRASRSGDTEKMAEIMAKYCTAVPEEWGAHNSADTFLDRPWRQLTDLAQQFIAEVNGKN